MAGQGLRASDERRGDGEPSLTVGTAGHIDHGKTALVRALTGRDTDRLEEERRRGMSIELGYAELAVAERRLSLVDVPGHERFVRTMIAGASGIDLFLLVVAADDGVMPQTREHVAVLRALGVGDGVVALTKVDLVDARRAEAVASEVRELLPGTEIVRASSRTGEGIDALLSSLGQAVERVDFRRALDGEEDGSGEVVLHVDRVFTVAGHGTVVTGTLWSGTLRRGDRVLVLPGGNEARVRSIESHDRSLEVVGPRRRVALNLAGLGRDEVERGDVIARAGGEGRGNMIGNADGARRADVIARAGGDGLGDATARTGGDGPGDPRQAGPTGRGVVRSTYRIDIELADGAVPIPGADPSTGRLEVEPTGRRVEILGERRVQVHHGTREAPARVVDLGDGVVQLRLEQPLLARRGDRVVIRRIAPPDTLGGAVVIDASPPRRSDRSGFSAEDFGSPATEIRHAPELAPEPEKSTEPSALARLVLAELEGDRDRPRTPAKLAEDMALGRREVERAIGELVDAREAVRFKADVVYPTASAARLSDAATALAIARGATSIGEVRDALGLSRKYAQALLEHLDGERVLRRDGDRHVPRSAGK